MSFLASGVTSKPWLEEEGVLLIALARNQSLTDHSRHCIHFKRDFSLLLSIGIPLWYLCVFFLGGSFSLSRLAPLKLPLGFVLFCVYSRLGYECALSDLLTASQFD